MLIQCFELTFSINRHSFLFRDSSGNLSVDAYEEECEFADPAGSFRGLNRFKRNCTNFGYLLETSNMKLMKWEDFEVRSQRFPCSDSTFVRYFCNLDIGWKQDKGIGHWRFRCVMSFPWKPILSGQASST